MACRRPFLCLEIRHSLKGTTRSLDDFPGSPDTTRDACVKASLLDQLSQKTTNKRIAGTVRIYNLIRWNQFNWKFPNGSILDQ